MIELTDFQEVVGLALDIPDEQAAQVQRAWPQTERELRGAMKQWRMITESKITGRELLLVCKEVWSQRPDDDLALAEGRTILYHPANGSPVPEGSPLDGIPLETLAFLKWSLDRGYLRWTDEVMIAREVKGAGGIIEDLPADRFYGKHSIPCTPEGKIDWSDLGLAAAKDFISKGHTAPATIPKEQPIYFGDDTLEGALGAQIIFRDTSARNRLLKGLPNGPAGAIRRSTAPGIDIANLVEAVNGFGRLSDGQWAINVLIDNAMGMLRGTAAGSALEAYKKN